MKKKVGMVLSVLLGLSAMGVGILHSSATEASPKLEEQEIRDVIGAQYPGTITELELEKDGSGAVYEAEIDDNGTEYELKLDGDTGEILKLDKKFAAKGSVEQDSGDKESNTKEKQKKTAISRMAMQSPALMITMTTAAKTVRTRMTMKKTAGTAWNSTRIPVTKMIMKQANKMIKRTKNKTLPVRLLSVQLKQKALPKTNLPGPLRNWNWMKMTDSCVMKLK